MGNHETKTKKTHSNTNEKKARSKFSFSLNQILLIIATLIVCYLAYVILIQWPIEDEEQVESIVNFPTEYVDDPEMEKWTERIEQAGIIGKKIDIWKVKRKGLLARTEYDRFLDRSEETEQPVKQIIRQGTRRWQYMICSDGSYHYYNDKEFTENGLGFTHASKDFCAEDGKGAMVELADNPPAKANNTNYNGSYSTTIPYRSSYNYNYTPSQSIPPEPTAQYNSPILNQWSPSGSTNTGVDSGVSDKWCGLVGNQYICR